MFFSPSGGWSAAEEPVSEKHRHCGATGSLAQCVVSELLRNSPVWRLPGLSAKSKKSQDWKVKRVQYQKYPQRNSPTLENFLDVRNAFKSALIFSHTVYLRQSENSVNIYL